MMIVLVIVVAAVGAPMVVPVAPVAPVAPVMFVPVSAPRRRHPDPFAPDIERDRKIVGDGRRPGAGPDLDDQGLAGEREPHEVGACGRDDGTVERVRRVREQPRHGPRTHHHVVPVRMAHRLDALLGEEEHGNALRDGQREQQQQRETPREAPRREPHARSTSPANR